jgi:hypothetical protein
MPYLEKELSLLSYNFIEISSVCNLSISINNTTDRCIKFSTNDIRLYNPLMLFARKKMISIYPDGFWAPMNKCRHILISIPDFKSFNYMAYIAESLVEFFKLIMKLKKDSEFTPVSKCKVSGCGAEASYYPSICHNHMHYLSKISLGALLTDKNAKISYSANQNNLIDILTILVEGYIRHGYNIGTDECVVCGYKTSLTYGFCNYCLGMNDLMAIEADLNNGILTDKDIIDGAWKYYFLSNDKELELFIKNAQLNRKRQEEADAKIESAKITARYFTDYTKFTTASGTAVGIQL